MTEQKDEDGGRAALKAEGCKTQDWHEDMLMLITLLPPSLKNNNNNNTKNVRGYKDKRFS